MIIKEIAKLLRISKSRIGIECGKITVSGSIDLEGCTELTALPDNLTVGGSIYLCGCTGLTALPDNLTVGGYIDLRGCTGLTALPDNLTVGGSIYMGETNIEKPKEINELSSRFLMELKIAIELKFNARGYSIADGILARIISTKGKVKKVMVFGKKDVSYLISDDQGNFAHGKTIKEAREDLIYKVVAKFEGDLPKSAKGKEWIGIYRAVTGACAEGCRLFIEKTGADIDATYTPQEIAELVKGHFGAEKFAEKLAD